VHTPVLTVILLIFIVWLQYEIRKSSRVADKGSDDFWNKEKQSNQSRRKDITSLDYLTINPELLPKANNDDATINSYRDTILLLSNKKILNLTGYTNTELKSLYGVANINLLSDYDNNYSILISILQKWAERLSANGDTSDAILVLEYAVSCNTVVLKSYQLLAELYFKQNTPEKIYPLLQTVSALKLNEKDKLIQSITDLLHS